MCQTRMYVKDSLGQAAIVLEASVGSTPMSAEPVTLSRSMMSFLALCRVPRCDHPYDTSYQVRHGDNLTLMGSLNYKELRVFLNTRANTNINTMRRHIMILALKGHKLEQLVAASLVDVSSSLILQREACLKCCLHSARSVSSNSSDREVIIMGD